MGTHPAGDGITWSLVEDVDVDQPHGKDYLYSQHIAKGVRKRSNKEHVAYGDATAGGEHTPGVASILRRVDGTDDVSAAYDASTFRNGGLVWSEGNDTLWCITADNTTGDVTVMTLNPNTQWKGGDVTWAGEHQWDASVTFTEGVDFSDVGVTKDLSVAGDISVGGDGDIIGDFSVGGNAAFGADISVDGTAVFGGDVSIDGNVQIDGSVTLNSDVAGIWKSDGTSTLVNDAGICGDWSTYDLSCGGRCLALVRCKQTHGSGTNVRIKFQSTANGDTTAMHTVSGAAIGCAQVAMYSDGAVEYAMVETDTNGQIDMIGDPTTVACTINLEGALGLEK